MRLRSTRSTVLLPGLIAVALAAAAGCGGGGEQASTNPPVRAATPTIVFEGASRFPDAGLRDWVSFADHVVVFTVSAEREVVTELPEKIAMGEYVIGREATLTIDQRLWSASDAPDLPSTIVMNVNGWAVKDGQRFAMVAEGAPRLEVGQRYLAPLLLMDDRSPAEWWPLTLASMLQLDADRVRPALPHTPSEAGRQLAGRVIGNVSEAVNRQPPDPIAQRYQHLRPAERVKKVLPSRVTPDQTQP